MAGRWTNRATATFDRWRRWCLARQNRSFVIAIVLGFALRLAWAIATTKAPTGLLSDPVQYRRIAEQLVDHHTPEVGGRPTAFWPPGWPATLAPLVWFTFKTGWLSMPFAASLLNTVSGTMTVALTAVLASRTLGGAARNPAAWIMAVAAGPIFYTSSMLAETWFVLLVVGVAVLGTSASTKARPLRWWAGIGVLIGYVVLVRGVGFGLILVPPLVARGRHGTWKGSWRPTAVLVAGTIVALLPWTIRNAVEVGVWTPTSTNTATQLCMGNHEAATGVYDASPRTGEQCFRHSPYDDPALYEGDATYADLQFSGPDEPAFYRHVTGTTVSWILRHPEDQLHLVPRKLFEIFRDGSGGLDAAEDFGAQPLPPGTGRDLLVSLERAWYWGVVTLAIAALCTLASARRSWLVWGLVVVQVMISLLGIGLNRYQLPLLPFFAVLAAGAVASLRSDGVRIGVVRPEHPEISRPAVDDAVS